MSELVITLLRLSYLVLLWLLVLACIGVLRRDIFGLRVSSRGKGRRGTGERGDRNSDRNNANADVAAPGRSIPVTLTVLAGPLAGTQLGLHTSSVLIGRAASCTLVVDDDTASGRHARIFPHDGGWYVEDLGSTNGTWLGDVRVSDPVPVPLGTPVRVGQTTLELRRGR